MDFTEKFNNFNKALSKEIATDADFIRAKASGDAYKFNLSKKSAIVSPLRFVKKGLYSTQIDKGYKGSVDVKDIYTWLGFKAPAKQTMSFAQSIAKKIMLVGTLKYRNKSLQTNIFAKAIEKTYPKLIKEIRKQVRHDIRIITK